MNQSPFDRSQSAQTPERAARAAQAQVSRVRWWAAVQSRVVLRWLTFREPPRTTRMEDHAKKVIQGLLETVQGRESLRQLATRGIQAGRRLRGLDTAGRNQIRAHIALLRLVRQVEQQVSK